MNAVDSSREKQSYPNPEVVQIPASFASSFVATICNLYYFSCDFTYITKAALRKVNRVRSIWYLDEGNLSVVGYPEKLKKKNPGRRQWQDISILLGKKTTYILYVHKITSSQDQLKTDLISFIID